MFNFNLFLFMQQFELQEEQPQRNDYEQNRNLFSRRVLFLHIFDTLATIRNAIKIAPLTSNDIPTIKEEDNCRILADEIYSKKQETEQNEYTPSNTLDFLYQTKKQTILMIFLYSLIAAIFEILGLVFLQLAIDQASKKGQIVFEKVYWFVLGIGGSWIGKAIANHNMFYEIAIIPAKLKNALILMIFEKISSMSEYSVKAQEIGKIINFISNDFNTIEGKMVFVMISLSLPIKIIGISVMLYLRLSWFFFLILFMIILIIVLQVLLGKLAATYLKQINISKDKRIKMVSELLEGIKIIKLYGWEMAFRSIIQTIRQTQIIGFMKLKLVKSLILTTRQASTYLSAFICFYVMYMMNSESLLSSSIILAALQPIMVLNEVMVFCGNAINVFFNLDVVLERFTTIMNAQDTRLKKIDPEQQIKQELPQNSEIQLVNFCGYWKKTQNPTIKNITFSFKRNKFYGIIGKIGSGKSSLFRAIIRQMPFSSGSILHKGQIAFSEQEPVIFATTFKENILFGRKYKKQKYQKILNCCCFDEDLVLWQKGDETVVGEKGLTLSGGQKARLALARALYSESDIYLLDDPLSAVDAKIGRKLYTKLSEHLFKKKTVLLVTHQTHFLDNCDQILEFENGQIKQKTEILNEQQLKKDSLHEKEQEEEEKTKKKRKYSLKAEQDVQVTCGSYPRYIFFDNINYLVFSFSFIIFIFYQLVISFIIKLYSDYDSAKTGKSQHFENLKQFWFALAILHVLSFITVILKAFLLQIAVLKSDEKIHSEMLLGIVRSPVSYFDITPSGQLTNKFSNDLGIMDNQIADCYIHIIEKSMLWAVMIGSLISIEQIYIVPLSICLIYFIITFWYCKESIIGIKQLSLKLKTPIFQQLRQMVSGLVQIQTLNQRPRFTEKFQTLLNYSLEGNISFISVERSFAILLSYFTIIILVIAMELGALNITEKNAPLYGVQILFVIRMLQSIQLLLKKIIEAESLMISAERTFNITRLQSEKELLTNYDSQNQLIEKENVFQSANIALKNVSFKYRQQLPLVLRDISFNIKDGEKVGIVGRTGAGKSSIIEALFRTSEPEQNSIYNIGNYDALKMGLHTLRTNISVIPQAPFLFRGTISQNIDPFQLKSQKELEQALQNTGLKEYIFSLPDKLKTMISNSSEVFSVGQKQLICLTRALIHKKKILVLDQATSNVDKDTDDFIQECLKTKFKTSTIITIAHRLHTIADYDKILVLDSGKIVQEGSPIELLKQGGVFFEMVQKTGADENKIWEKAKLKE